MASSRRQRRTRCYTPFGEERGIDGIASSGQRIVLSLTGSAASIGRVVARNAFERAVGLTALGGVARR